MRTRPRQSTPDFRADALAMLDQSDRSIADVAEDLGINVHTLKYWRKQQRMKRKKKPAAAPRNDREPKQATLEQKVARLERENAQLRMDREILNKAAAFFAKEGE
jgi:transposase